MAIKVVQTGAAPLAVGPYSQAVQIGSTIYCSGQLGMDPDTGELVGAEVGEQTRRVLQNLAAVLAVSGSGLAHVLKTTVYLADMDDFAAMNAVYAEAFGEHRPARATVEVSRLPKDARVEIDCIAVIPPERPLSAA